MRGLWLCFRSQTPRFPMVRSPNPQKVSLWQSHIDAQAVSVLSIATFYKGQQISVQTFYQWKRELQTEDSKPNASSTPQTTAAPSTATCFVQLLPSRPIARSEAIREIHFPSGACMKQPSDKPHNRGIGFAGGSTASRSRSDCRRVLWVKQSLTSIINGKV